jgi:ribosomal protein L35
MSKLRKSFTKRLKTTKTGKVLRRISGQSHFLAKKSSVVLKRKKKLKLAPKEFLTYKNY